ncbi:hypothetical protein SUDANB120_04213 [Streptomyces sp. enrichment culture]|uniref:lactococcin 972 family bacteriocin n=1 Tax=Streptomyces sp. enrichment culture TaxID=1795815 RepID=UPI003F548DB8
MKKPGKMTLGVVSAMAAAGALLASGPAVAADSAVEAAPQVRMFSAANGDTPPAELIGPNGEKPVEWGAVSFPKAAKGEGPSNAPAVASVSVGGGTWHYGTSAGSGGLKKCYSNYIHPTKKHSASVAIASQTDKDIQNADIWAKASRTAGWAYTCNTYWGVY